MRPLTASFRQYYFQVIQHSKCHDWWGFRWVGDSNTVLEYFEGSCSPHLRQAIDRLNMGIFSDSLEASCQSLADVVPRVWLTVVAMKLFTASLPRDMAWFRLLFQWHSGA
jgi:hypothetical protein